jgi:hypothetical protein
MPWTTTVNIADRLNTPNYAMADKNAVQDVRVGGFFTYDAGAMSFGAITEYIRWHGGPESQYNEFNRVAYMPHDNTLQYGTAYVKYNNGRFFFNAEGAFIKTDTHRQNSYDPQSLAGVGVYGGRLNPIAPTYTEHARYMVEAGVFAGPAKLSLFWGYVEGGTAFISTVRQTRAGYHSSATIACSGLTASCLPGTTGPATDRIPHGLWA